MSNKIEKWTSNLINGKKKNIFSYLLYAVLLIILSIGILSKVIFTSLVLKKKRLE